MDKIFKYLTDRTFFFLNFYLKYNFKHMSESLGNTVIHKHWGRRRQQLEYKKATQSIEE